MSELTLTELLPMLLVLLLIEGFFSGSEIALLSSDTSKLTELKDKGSLGARLAINLKLNPEQVFSTTLVITSFCVIAFSSLITLFLHPRMSSRYLEIASILVASPSIVLFGELIPKSVFQRFANRISPIVSFPITILSRLLLPITYPLSLYTKQIGKAAAPLEEVVRGKRKSTRNVLQNILKSKKQESELSSTERGMLERILKFHDKRVRFAQIDLVNVSALEQSVTVREAIDFFLEHQHSQMPVFEERIDNITGYVHMDDILKSTRLDLPLSYFAKTVTYVPENQLLVDALIDLRTRGERLAVVVNEYGGATGVLTTEDILEQIVGDIVDEHDPDEFEGIREIGSNRWLVKAHTPVSELARLFDIQFPEGDFETLAGLLIHLFGRIPQAKDKIQIEHLMITIRQASARKVDTVLVEKVAEKNAGKLAD